MTQTAEQYASYRRDLIAGLVRDIAIMRGGTGHLRRELTPKEREQRRKKRLAVKASRRANWGR